MVARVTHTFVSGKAAGIDSTRVYGTHWDADHTIEGLDNVDNTSDVDKPISSLTQDALDALNDRIADDTIVLDTVAALEAATVSGTVDSVHLLGYYTAIDGAAAIYDRAVSEPTHDGKIQSDDGAWWELRPTNGLCYLAQFGSKTANAAFDNAAALDAAVSFATEKALGRVMLGPGQLYFLTAPSPITVGITLEGEGMSSSNTHGGTILRRKFTQGAAVPFLHWDGTGAASNSSGGGLRKVSILADQGTTGGIAIFLEAQSATLRPGYMMLEEILIAGYVDGQWGYGIFQDGHLCTTAGSQGLRDLTYSTVYVSGATVFTVLLGNATNTFFKGLYVFTGTGSVAELRISGASAVAEEMSTNASGFVSVSGTLTLDFCDNIHLTGFASTVTKTGNATNTPTFGLATADTGTGSVVRATAPTIAGITVTGTATISGTTTNDSAAAGIIGEYTDTSTGNNNASATVTMTIAAPCVVTWTTHGFRVGAATTAIKFTTTGALPTGITASTTYYAKAVDANTFKISTTADNALAGTFITTTGSQSGVQTGDIRIVMVSVTPQNVAAISLTAGDWDVGGQMLKGAGSATTVTYLGGNLATTTAAQDRTFGRRLSLQYSANTFVPGSAEFTVFDFADARFSLSATTTIYLVADDQFGTSTLSSSGWLRARRVR